MTTPTLKNIPMISSCYAAYWMKMLWAIHFVRLTNVPVEIGGQR